MLHRRVVRVIRRFRLCCGRFLLEAIVVFLQHVYDHAVLHGELCIGREVQVHHPDKIRWRGVSGLGGQRKLHLYDANERKQRGFGTAKRKLNSTLEDRLICASKIGAVPATPQPELVPKRAGTEERNVMVWRPKKRSGESDLGESLPLEALRRLYFSVSEEIIQGPMRLVLAAFSTMAARDSERREV